MTTCPNWAKENVDEAVVRASCGTSSIRSNQATSLDPLFGSSDMPDCATLLAPLSDRRPAGLNDKGIKHADQVAHICTS